LKMPNGSWMTRETLHTHYNVQISVYMPGEMSYYSILLLELGYNAAVKSRWQ
jgi:hypothetical protein